SKWQYRQRIDRSGYGNQKTVPPACQCFDEPGTLGAIAKCGAEPIDGFVQPTFNIDFGLRAPNGLSEFVSGDQFARIFQQGCQDLKRLLLERNRPTVPQELARAKIRDEFVKTDA